MLMQCYKEEFSLTSLERKEVKYLSLELNENTRELTVGSLAPEPVGVLLLQLLVILHGGPRQGLHDQFLRSLIVNGEGLAEADNQHGSILLVHRLVVKVNIIDKFDGLGVMDRCPAYSHSGK